MTLSKLANPVEFTAINAGVSTGVASLNGDLRIGIFFDRVYSKRAFLFFFRYNFVDKDGKKVSLRPEMTPTLARMILSLGGKVRFALAAPLYIYIYMYI